MRKFSFFLIAFLSGLFAVGQAPLYLGTKTPYVAPAVSYTPPPAGFKPVFVNYAGRHGARYMTKAGADVDALRLLEAADKVQGLTETGRKVEGMVRKLCEVEKGQYENITLLGAEEQEAIGSRMLSRYGPAFTGRGIDVVVTYKVRTQQSADAFLKGLAGYKGQRRFSKQPDSLDAVLRFYDLSPAYQQYKKSAGLKKVFDSLDRDRRTAAAAAAVSERVFTAGFRAGMKAGEELKFAANLYDLYSVQFSLVRETKDGVDLGIAFGKDELSWEDYASGAQDFLEKGPGRDPLGIQVKVAAPLLADFIRTTDGIVGRRGMGKGDERGGDAADAVLRFTHAEAISPFATLLGIPEASVPAAGIYTYHEHWQAEKVIPLSANIQWIVYGNGKEYLVKVLLNEREVRLPRLGVFAAGGGVYYRWEDLRAYCLGRLKAVGAELDGNQVEYLKKLR
ncbi:MAG TPA: histidine-type phosphatase [Puia sp.]